MTARDDGGGGGGVNIRVFEFMGLQASRPERRRHKERLIAHRRERSLSLGPCMRLQFEDERTIRHQIEQIVRAERITGAIRDEIETCAHLMPNGTSWQATLLIELPDARERRRELPRLNEAAHELHVVVAGHPLVRARVNEDLPDRHRARPSAVHFLRFELPAPLRPHLDAALAEGALTAAALMGMNNT